LIDDFDAMSVDNIKDTKKKASMSAFFSMKSHHPWFPVLVVDTTGCKNLMINFYLHYVHKDNFMLEIEKKGMKLGTTPPPLISLTRHEL
jgi:hypothetical protein